MDTVVLIMSETCHHCKVFHNNKWPGLKEELIKRGDVNVVEMILNGDMQIPQEYHPDLKKYIGWFPTIGLFPTSNWLDHNSKLNGIIKNGRVTPNGVANVPTVKVSSDGTETKKQVDYSKGALMKWIDSNKSSNKYQKPPIMITENGRTVTLDDLSNLSLNEKVLIPTYGSFKHETFDE